MDPLVRLVGARSRAPFVGHFRGSARSPSGLVLAWAGSLHATAGVEEGWEAAEAARDALATMDLRGADGFGAVEAARRALLALPARWIGREDLTILLVAREEHGALAHAAGLAEVWCQTDAGWRKVPSNALSSDANTWSVAVPVEGNGWTGVPHGALFPAKNLDAACGVRG